MLYQILQCIRPNCRFRFHVPLEAGKVYTCPKCGSVTRVVVPPYENLHIQNIPSQTNTPHIEVILDNIRSTFNVGSIFRSADGAGVQFIYLCGITPTPDHPKMSKTALGAEYSIPWVQAWNIEETVIEHKKKGNQIWALEGGEHSKSIFEIAPPVLDQPITLIVGNEISGVDPGILTYCDKIVYIPMAGIKQSLNVAIAFSIAIYTMRYGKLHHSVDDTTSKK